MRRLIAAILATALLAGAGCTPGAGPRWEWANPRPVGEALTSVTFGDGRYVAVGLLGNIATSTDGENWEAASVETDAMLYGVAYGNGRFVAVGTTWPDSPPLSQSETSPPPEKPVPIPQVVYTSRSGQQWQRGTTGAPGRLEGVAFGQGRFVAVGNNGIFSSTDGVAWTEVAQPKRKLYSVVYGGGQFVAVGMGCAFTSEDGVNWTESAGIDKWAELRQVTHAQGLFVAVSSGGQIITSADGMTWTKRKDAKLPLTAVSHWQGRFLAVVGRVPYVSTDGAAWTVAADAALPANVTSMAAGDDRLVAVGDRGAIVSSRDGIAWAEHAPALASLFLSVAHGAQRYVAVAHRSSLPFGQLDDPRHPTVAVSKDGVAWTAAAEPVAEDLREVVFGNGVFVAIGWGIYTSADGDHWAQTLGDDRQLSALAFGGGRFVAAASVPGSIFTSTDGKTWDEVQVDLPRDARMGSLAWGSGRFVGVGEDGAGLVSTDGRTWTRVQVPVDELYDVAFGQGKFVAVGGNGEVLTSSDGVQWTVHENSPAILFSIAYGDGWFVATGPRGSVYASEDGVTWVRIPRVTTYLLKAAAFAGDRYFLLGEGTIISRRQWEEE
ncbi:MAG TPA: hypothetical protein VD973_18050 [Symbiobacteriaceae bacterium]|nr:hypothetical protein [Symbiobacteriaceae bacterium]